MWQIKDAFGARPEWDLAAWHERMYGTFFGGADDISVRPT